MGSCDSSSERPTCETTMQFINCYTININATRISLWAKHPIFSSVQFIPFICSVVSDSLRPHESQHTKPPCSSPSPGVHSDSRPSSQWCHPAISSSVVPFSSCPQSLPASESFPVSQLFAWGGQSTGVSASASFLPEKSQGWSPSEWTGWISLQSKGLSTVFSNTAVQRAYIAQKEASGVPNVACGGRNWNSLSVHTCCNSSLPHGVTVEHESCTVQWLLVYTA